MRITLCTFDIPNHTGGPNVWLKRLLPQLENAGCVIRVLLLTTKRGGPMATWLKSASIPFAETDLRGYTEDTVRWIYTQAASDQPDIFIPHCLAAAYFAAKWIKAAGVPTVGVVHADDEFHAGLLDNFVYGRPEYRLSSLACVSRFLETKVMEQPPEETQVGWFPCGAPVPAHCAQVPNETLRLIYAGRLEEEQKRISDLTRSLCQAVRIIPGVEAAIYGEGSAHGAVQQILETEGAGLPVTLVGKVDSNKIQAEMLNGHAFVLLSDYEGLPIAVMEAMACGLVPICLDIRSGIPELVENGKTGFLVVNRDDSFISAVARLRSDPDLWCKMSIEARTRIQEVYSDQACAARWIAHLSELGVRANTTTWAPLPKKLNLPPVDPRLAREDRRAPFFAKRAYLNLRSMAGRIKRSLTSATTAI